MKAHLFSLLAAGLCVTVLSDSSTVEWCYHLPSCNDSTWAVKSPVHCNGTRQSPVNIVTGEVKRDANLTAFTFTGFNDNSNILQISNADGKSVKVDLDDSKMNISGGALQGVYKSVQFHIHWGNKSQSNGSEHTVDGRRYPMELHIVNYKSTFQNLTAALENSEGLAVLGFFIDVASGNGTPASWNNLTSSLSQIPKKGNVEDIMNTLTMNSLIEGVNMNKYYRYMGSLTTPTCNEAVVWTVFEEPIKISQNLIDLFSSTMYINTTADPLMTNTYRNVQPLNSRIITYSSANIHYPALSITALLYCVLCVL